MPVAAPPVELEDADDSADDAEDASDRSHDGEAEVPGSATPDAQEPPTGTGEPDADGGPADGSTDPTPSVARERGPRPAVTPGLPIGAYSDDELDDLAAWIDSDGVERDQDALMATLREELGLTRRGLEVDRALHAVASRRR